MVKSHEIRKRSSPFLQQQPPGQWNGRRIDRKGMGKERDGSENCRHIKTKRGGTGKR